MVLNEIRKIIYFYVYPPMWCEYTQTQWRIRSHLVNGMVAGQILCGNHEIYDAQPIEVQIVYCTNLRLFKNITLYITEGTIGAEVVFKKNFFKELLVSERYFFYLG